LRSASCSLPPRRKHTQYKDDPLIPRPPTTPESVEESLEDYFYEQVFVNKTWKREKDMPRKDRDKEYDSFLEKLGLEGKTRKKAAEVYLE